MKKYNIALALLMVLGVTACGSSGGSSSSAPENNPSTTTPTVTTQPTTDTVNTPANEEKPSTEPAPPVENIQSDSPYARKDGMVGGGFILPKEEGEIQTVFLKGHSEEDFGSITVEGKNIALIPGGFKTKHFTSNASNMIRNVNMQDYTAWGLLWDKELKNQYLTTQGIKATTDMPKNGTYTYKGSAIQFSGENKAINVDTATSIENAEFTADFDRKVFTGIIPQQDVNNPVILSAEITNNTFAGESNGLKTNGGFFGPQASEVIGDYYSTNEKPVVGVFGAKKQ